MKTILLRGDKGADVAALRDALVAALGKSAKDYRGLGSVSQEFDATLEAALQRWQADLGWVADGIAGPRCQVELGIRPPTPLQTPLTADDVAALFPFTRRSNIVRHLPYVLAALGAFDLTSRDMVLMALATIRAETEGFVPIAEQPSRFNTLPGKAAFSAYEGKLGNEATGDGGLFRGRGFVQLTGRANYKKYGKLLEIPLEARPDLAMAPEIAAALLAAYLHNARSDIARALRGGDLAAARKVVNGGTHGLDRFADAFERAEAKWPAGAAKEAPRKAARQPKGPAAYGSIREVLTVVPDATDLRDCPYRPAPTSLPDRYPSDADIKQHLPNYTKAGLILNQGREGACTGFGLACVANYLRWKMLGRPQKLESVSPRMLYELARRYDEYEGEDYDGSSCRGALKGWHHHGVCLAGDWPFATGAHGLTQPKRGWAERAIEQTLGVYYRIDAQVITDLQAAIHEVGAIYVSAYTHDGWDDVADGITPDSHADLPVIRWNGRRSRKNGHAFAMVGFNRAGFVIQNSWGDDWGAGGFAVLTYADWLAHAMDAWVAALGVPGVVGGRLTGGRARVAAKNGAVGDGAHWWQENSAYDYSIVIGNNGRIRRYLTEDEVSRTLQYQACVLPDTWFRQQANAAHAKKRLVIYAHGGLNGEADAIDRAQAMGPYFTGNGCYPLFLVWKTGLLESIGNILAEKFGLASRAGLAGASVGEMISETTDKLIEKTIGRPFARPIWSEMKENAALAGRPERAGGLLVDAVAGLADRWGKDFELHLVGHSAGAIILGHLLQLFAQKRINGDKPLSESIASLHLYAPACTVEFANRYYAPHTQLMERLHLDILSDDIERDDNVAAIYRKSLLYLVSNALESDQPMPILGMEKVFRAERDKWDGTSYTAETLSNWRFAAEESGLAERTRVHREKKIVVTKEHDRPVVRANAGHGDSTTTLR